MQMSAPRPFSPKNSPSPSPSHAAGFFRTVLAFLKSNTVFCIALLAAVITGILIPPDAAYLSYFDFKTLTCLFCVLAVVCALRNIRFFTFLARKIVARFTTLRSASIALVTVTFVGSMLIANDMALLTFLPLGYLVLTETHKERHMAFVFIMQNIAANLGGMLTPFGNPQNLYLYSKFNIPTGEFTAIMAPPFAAAIVMILGICMLLPAEPLTVTENDEIHLPARLTALYLVLFTLSIAIVFRTIPYPTGLIVIPPILLFADRDALKKVDYGLLGTFCAFFVFSGNMSRIPAVRSVFSALLEKNTMLVSALSCQCISNVPTAILMSQFTENYKALLYGVNIGGAGTLIASLASLITFREYSRHNPGKTGAYILKFSVFNFSFLVILLLFCQFFCL
ncbi:MAG: citrate transporter [Clostridia bacterium]|nr:citrate transporter [Clostridia bacterium]